MKKISKLLIGTNNKGKYKEIRDLLPRYIKTYSTGDFKLKSPKEDGLTFEENSLIKSKYFSKKTKLLCLADDSGLEIDILNKDPGIYSARWGGKDGDFKKAIKRVYRELFKKDKSWQQKKIKARFVCALSICDIDKKIFLEKLKDLKELPNLVEQTLMIDNKIQSISNTFNKAKGSMFLGRGFSFPIALEGALKLKELSYIHAEGYPAGEMKHGPLALIEEGMPVVVLAPRDNYYKKTISNMQEVIARGAKVLLVTNKSSDEVVSENIWEKIEVESANEDLLPFLLTIPLQKLAYYSALKKGFDIDKPRNLAKSVTVE